MRIGWVGDVHSKVEDLEDCRRLADLLVEAEEQKKPDLWVFLGDQYDTHAIVHVEVQRFWMETFDRLKAGKVALVGNHDRPGNAAATAHAMQVHRKQVMVVDEPFFYQGLLFLPYYHDGSKMVEEAGRFISEFKPAVMACHQTFQGATYDNGFYAKDGIDADLFDVPVIISGHIHTPSLFGKVRYVGSPRWQTVSDANVDRHILFTDHAKDGSLIPEMNFLAVPTDRLRRIWSVTDSPGDDAQQKLQVAKPGDRIVIDIHGPTPFIEERKRVLSGPGIRIRTFPTDRAAPKLSEAEGIPVAFQKYVAAYKPAHGTPKEKLVQMAEERIHVG